MRFGIGMKRGAQPVRGTGEHGADHTLEEVGRAVLGDTRERIRQIEGEGTEEAQASEPLAEDEHFSRPVSRRNVIVTRSLSGPTSSTIGVARGMRGAM